MGNIRDEFINPPEEYTPIPFWFWNDDLRKEEILRQIHDFKDKGVNGFVLHPRIGIPKEVGYLSDLFMELVHAAVTEAHKLGMTVILYDEGMYPSGSANGQVVKENLQYASRGLKMVEHACQPGENKITVELLEGEELVSIQVVEKHSHSTVHLENTKILDKTKKKLSFTPPTKNNWSILFFIETYTKGTIRGIHFGEDDGEEEAPPSADLLNPDAVRTYIRLTHEKYYTVLKEYFGNTVIAMFTDEPDMLGRNALPNLKPWTRGFLNFFKKNGNKESDLPALWFEAGDRTIGIRKKFQNTLNKRLTASYYKPISDWCTTHGIALTGHPANSDDIGLLDHFQIPGQDVVWRWVAPEDGKSLVGEHSTAGKCSADAARHRGRRRNLNEVLGVCGKESGWALSPGDMKWYFDWLFVRGVNLICPHAFYYSVDGKRRSHERPPDVGPNNNWWPYYKLFAQYIKRMSALMTDSVNKTDIAVLCEEDHLPWKIVKPLYENQIEFNYLEESLLLKKCQVEKGCIHIERQTYKVVIVENTKLLGEDTIIRLKSLIEEGGHVIILSNETGTEIKGSITIYNETSIIQALDRVRERQLLLTPNNKAIRISKIEKQGFIFYVVVNEGEENYTGSLLVNEKGKVERWDPWDGTIESVHVKHSGPNIAIPIVVNRRESFVYCVDPKTEQLLTHNVKRITKSNKSLSLPDNWSIRSETALLEKNELESWSNWDDMKHFSGTLIYENTFQIREEEMEKAIILDLGEVYEIARVSINAKEIGVKMWAPYRYEIINKHIKLGKNTLRVEVTNSKANEMDKMSLRSGLIGPVSIEIT